MKKINDYRKLLGVTETTELKELKSIYRTIMKDAHPDKFFDSVELKEQAELRSKEIIEAYHFLVSIAPETIEQTKEAFNQTLATAGIVDFKYEKQVLKVIFADGNTYEFFGVPYNTYTKMVNSDSCARFVRRHISGSFVYRSASKLVAA
ncbi:MAG: KTSC domain-containing protein [Flavobacteriales bacterium]|nr:KTSC domain-containing protein [Flavobacteriales bacterium]